MKIAFLGTPDFAIPSLEMLSKTAHEVAVFTQPDRPVGRHGVLTPPPVKQYALEHGIPVFQFEKIRSQEGVSSLKQFGPDLMVTAAFGQLLSEENLSVPKFGCVNVHGSLLPKYRGAAPIQWAVIHGEQVTGITTMQTDIGLDTGDILMQSSTPIGPDETSGELYKRLSRLGADVLRSTVSALENGTLERHPQDEKLATKCGQLKKEDGKIDFHRTCLEIHNLVRGTNPWPGAFCNLDNRILKIWKTRLLSQSDVSLPAGTCDGDAKRGFFVQCSDGMLEILELQASNGKRMDARSFLCGVHPAGKILT